MRINDICEAIEADLPRTCGHLRGCGCDEDRQRLAIVLATLRAVGVYYHEGYTTNAPVDEDARAIVSARMRAVAVASKEMRRGHEGCVTQPSCGSCFRCDFDRAVDDLIAAEAKKASE